MSDASRAARARHHGGGAGDTATAGGRPPRWRSPPRRPWRRWHEVWWGGWGTAGLFTLGNAVTGDSSGQASVGSASGAAGSLVTWLVWG
jgi:hypothetical protein